LSSPRTRETPTRMPVVASGRVRVENNFGRDIKEERIKL
jgi:hypothetical protein